MAQLNQRIPNFLGGVSQQPDKIKFPGQLRVCDNAVPDITFGLTKRPSAEQVKTLTNATSSGFWYEIIRDGDEKYLVQITESNVGSSPAVHPIRVWNLQTGVEQTLTNSANDSIFSYLDGATSPYAVTSIQDYTLIANPQKTVTTSGNTFSPIDNGDYAFARLDTIAYNTEYVLYSGTTPPSPNTYYRCTSVRVEYLLNNTTESGPTYDETNADGRRAGQLTWSFSTNTSGAAVASSSNKSNCRDIEGSLQVNATNFVAAQNKVFDGTEAGTPDEEIADNFLGFEQDYDVRYTATVTLTNGGIIKETNAGTARAKYIDVDLEGRRYRIHVEGIQAVKTYEDVSGIAYFKTPKNPDEGPLSMVTILEGLKDSIDSNFTNAQLNGQVIGSGLYLDGTVASSINFLGGAVNENMSVIGQKAQDISRLPAMCKHGYVAQISNTSDTDVDDYYVKFEATNGSSGVGSWEECVRPHNFSSSSDPMVAGLTASTMPHALINNRNGTFTFARLNETFANSANNQNYWKLRQVGDDTSNPFPSFVGNEIQDMFFHRNRLALVSGEHVVMSKPGEYFDFFIVSAITFSDDNPIDITMNDIKPAFINHSLPINKGMVLFSDNGQFLLFTESDIFSPKTVRIKKVSSYECDSSIKPVDLGTSVLFTSNVSSHARAFEATILDDDTPPNIIEQTRVVPEFLPKDITMSANSASIGITSYCKKGEKTIYHYKYYNVGNERQQSAWYTWSYANTVQHMVYTGGNFFVVLYDGTNYQLVRHEFVTDINNSSISSGYTVGGLSTNVGSPLHTTRGIEACLDLAVITGGTHTDAHSVAASGSTQAYEEFGRVGTAAPTWPTLTDLVVVGLYGKDNNNVDVAGMVLPVDELNGTKVRVFNSGLSLGTLSGVYGQGTPHSAHFAIGYKYKTTIELPNYYFNVGNNAYDTNGELRISGINFELGLSGPMEFHLTSPFSYTDASGNVTKDIDDYVQYESGILTNISQLNTVPSELDKSVRVPIQRKNNKYNLQIQIPDPFSTAIISGSWDGNYSNKRHVRR